MDTPYCYPPVNPEKDVLTLAGPKAAKVRGLLGRRMDAVRENRLHRIIDHPLVLQGFEERTVRLTFGRPTQVADKKQAGHKTQTEDGPDQQPDCSEYPVTVQPGPGRHCRRAKSLTGQ